MSAEEEQKKLQIQTIFDKVRLFSQKNWNCEAALNNPQHCFYKFCFILLNMFYNFFQKQFLKVLYFFTRKVTAKKEQKTTVFKLC